MSREIRLAVTVPLPDDPTATATTAKTVMLAWEQFTAAIKGTGAIGDDFYVGPGKIRRRRRSKLRVVSEPPTAA